MLNTSILGKECGENVLFFGCRHSNQDYLYKDELKEYQKEGTITLFEAFSRDTVSATDWLSEVR